MNNTVAVFLTIPLDKLPCLLPFSPLGTKVEKEIVVLHSFFNYTHIHCHLVKCMNIFRVDQNLKFPVKAIFWSKVKYKSGSGKFVLNLSIFWIDQIKLNSNKSCAKIQDSWFWTCLLDFILEIIKVHIFWEGHKVLRNLPRFFWQIYGGDFTKISGLLRVYEL